MVTICPLWLLSWWRAWCWWRWLSAWSTCTVGELSGHEGPMRAPATVAPTPAWRSRRRRTSWCPTWSWTSSQSSRAAPTRTGPDLKLDRLISTWHLCFFFVASFENQKKIFKVLKGCVERSRFWFFFFLLNPRVINPLLPRLNSSSNSSPDKENQTPPCAQHSWRP